MAETHFVFTRARLLALPAPSSCRVTYYDTKSPGLACRVTPNGARSFYFTRRFGRQVVWLRLAGVAELPVDDARNEVARLNAEVAAGRDPRETKRKAQREEPTFGALWNEWLTKHGCRLKSHREWQRIYKAYLGGWSTRRLGTIKQATVAALHMRLGDENGRVQANRVLSLVKMIYGAAAGIGWHSENPARGVKKFPEEKRERYLQAEELPKFFKALAEEPSPILQGFFALCLFTAARRGTIQRMKWSELDLFNPAGPVWRCPETKRGKPQTVNLVPLAVEVLEKLRPLTGAGEYVFPAMRAGKRGLPYLADPMPAFRRLCERAGLESLTIHDLRRSAGSWAAISGASMRTIAEVLGHAAGSSETAIYARLNQEAARVALSTAVDRMLALGGSIKLLTDVESAAPAPKTIDAESKPSDSTGSGE